MEAFQRRQLAAVTGGGGGGAYAPKSLQHQDLRDMVDTQALADQDLQSVVA